MSCLASYREDCTPDKINDSSTYNKLSATLYPRQKFELLAALEWIENVLCNDWNGYDTSKPNNQSIAMARQFIERLPLAKLHANTLAPDGDGGLCLKWKNGNESIILTLDGIFLHMSYDDGQGNPVFISDISYFDASFPIPQEILKHIPNAPRNTTTNRN